MCAVEILGGEESRGRAIGSAVRDEQLKKEIGRVWSGTGRGVYGARKVWTQLNREGVDVARCTVERLMRELGLSAVCAVLSASATVPGVVRPGGLLERDFTADAGPRRVAGVRREPLGCSGSPGIAPRGRCDAGRPGRPGRRRWH